MQMTKVGTQAGLVSETKRLEWCDIYKGIVILLVVIGHFTKQYQVYIYQFHMAAFFFISGYTTNFKKYSTSEIIVKKFCTLMLPYYFFTVIGTVIFYVLSKLGVLSYVSGTSFPDKFQDAFLTIFTNGAAWCDWLGALWFVPVLFGACIIAKTLYSICDNSNDIYAYTYSIFLFVIGQNVNYKGDTFPVDLIFIAQYYVVLGSVVKERSSRVKDKWIPVNRYIIYSVLLIIAVISFCSIGTRYTVDWPSRKFNGFIDLVNPLCGIIICIALSMFIEKIKYLKAVFISMGTYSFAIMVFHFLGFKLSYMFLVLSGKEDINVLASLTPTDSVRTNIWWGGAVALSIIASVCVWKLLMQFQIVRICCGKSLCIEKNFLEDPLVNAFRSTYMCVIELFKELLYATQKKLLKLKKYIVHIIAVMVSFLLVNLYAVSGYLYVDFPYYGRRIYFEEGWLEQGQNENYRWVEMTSKAAVILLDQENMHVHGYIPDNVENISEMQLFINGEEVYCTDVSPNCEIDIELSIIPYKKVGLNDFELVFDGCRIPGEDDADIRSFSALIDLMTFK